jgi:hypothetical protein
MAKLMAIREVRIIEVIEHIIEIETKKNWRHAEEIALDHLSLMQTPEEAAETIKHIVSHKFESEFSLNRMTEYGEVDLNANKSKAKSGMRLV